MAEPKTTSAEAELAEDLLAKVEAAEAEEQGPPLVRKKDVYDHVTVATGLRKREVREAVDETLAYLHSCLADGKTVQLPPLGKIRAIEKGSGAKAKLIYKLNLQKQKPASDDAVE